MKVLKVLTETIHVNGRKHLVKFLNQFFETKYKDHKGPIQTCLLYCEEGKMILDLSGLKTELFIPRGNGVAIGKQIRALCGQHILMRFGLPLKEEKIPVLILIPDIISLVRYLGKLHTYQLLFNWRGESKVGEAVVVRYSLLS